MKQHWQLIDIIDLEFFLDRDVQLLKNKDYAYLSSRDRDIYLQHIQPALPDSHDPKLLVKAWLSYRRAGTDQEDDGPAPLPGSLWREFYTLSTWLFFLGGTSLGCGLAAGFLSYTGSAPLNASMFLALFVILQLLLLILQMGGIFYRRLRGKHLSSSLLYTLLSRMLFKAMTRASVLLHRKITGPQRLRLKAFAGDLQRKKKQYPGLALWPPFRLMQLSGIGFNLGVICTLLFKVSVADIAFGWQSTLQLSETLVADLVRGVALPWSWCIPGHYAYPSLEQITGSKMVLKDGIYHLATQDLVSWWPFLCMAVLTYGLLPRALLLLYGIRKEYRLLDRINLGTPAIRQLLQRMLTPLVTTRGQVTAADRKVQQSSEQRREKSGALPGPLPGPSTADIGTTLVLLPDELYRAGTTGELEDLLSDRCRPPIQMLRFGGLDQTDEELYTAVEHAGDVAGLILIQEAWQPPIEETFSLLHHLRRQVSPQTPLTVALLGKPEPASIFTQARSQDIEIWSDKISSVGDPYLEMYPLVVK